MNFLQIYTEPQYITKKARNNKPSFRTTRVPYLNLEHYDRDQLRELAESGGILYWCHGGMWRKVPNSVLRNTLSLMLDLEQLRNTRPNATMPRGSTDITWDQTVTPQDLKSASEAPHLRLHQSPTNPSQPNGTC